MLDTLTRRQDETATYPTTGVRISIIHHIQTSGGYRLRFAFDKPVAEILRRGLAFPRVVIDGDMVNGLRIYATQDPGRSTSLQPILAQSGAWSVFVSAARYRTARAPVPTTPVDFEWQLDEPGPVLLIPRLPDVMLPQPVVDKLPNSQVDQATIMERAEKRFQRDMRKLYEEAAALDDEAVTSAEPEPEPEPQGEPIAPLAPTIVDLKDALAMVNELVDQLGDEVVLSIDANGHVRAKRRIVQFIDL